MTYQDDEGSLLNGIFKAFLHGWRILTTRKVIHLCVEAWTHFQVPKYRHNLCRHHIRVLSVRGGDLAHPYCSELIFKLQTHFLVKEHPEAETPLDSR